MEDNKENAKKEELWLKRSDFYVDRIAKERIQVMKSRFSLDQSFDKYLLTFSTGTLYLSVYILRDFFIYSYCILFLILGWLFLIISMFTSLGSLCFSKKSYEHLENYLNDEISREFDLQAGKDKNYNYYNNKHNHKIEYFERISIACFIFGVIAIFFYIINIIFII